MSYLGKIVKGAIILGAVGALLAVAAPVIAGWAGVSMASVGISANAAWTAAYFGAFGGINAAVEPLVSAIWPKQRHHTSYTRQGLPVVAVTAGTASADMAPDLAQEHAPTHFQNKVAASRVAGQEHGV